MRNATDTFELFVDGVRRVVGCNVVDAPRFNAAIIFKTVFRATQRRIHLQPQPTVICEHAVIKEEVMRRNFASDADAMFLASILFQASCVE